MTTGNIKITIYHNKVAHDIDGEFVDGILSKGVIKYNDTELHGTFDPKMQLHGENCKKIYKNTIQEGTFNNGKLQNGSIYYDKQLFERGQFANGYLSKGYRLIHHSTQNGLFNNGSLYKGYIEYSDQTMHIGYFGYDNKLLKGFIKCANGFRAYAEYDNNRNLLNCQVNYKGDIKLLTSEQLIMYCCSGSNAVVTYSIYQQYLTNMHADALLMLTSHMINTHNLTSIIGLNLIIENLSFAKDNKHLNHIHPDTIKQLKSDIINDNVITDIIEYSAEPNPANEYSAEPNPANELLSDIPSNPTKYRKLVSETNDKVYPKIESMIKDTTALAASAGATSAGAPYKAPISDYNKFNSMLPITLPPAPLSHAPLPPAPLAHAPLPPAPLSHAPLPPNPYEFPNILSNYKLLLNEKYDSHY